MFVVGEGSIGDSEGDIDNKGEGNIGDSEGDIDNRGCLKVL